MAGKIYLAGPDVFLPGAVEVGRRKLEICRQFGFEGLFPLDPDPGIEADPTAIFRADCALMRRADIGLFNLTPFRGPSADAGTVFELGFMFALGKPVYGYTGTSSVYADQVERQCGPLVARDGRLWDRSGYEVEDFDLIDNLMIIGAIREAGGALAAVETITPDVIPPGSETTRKEQWLAAFDAFAGCLQQVQNDVRSGRLKLER